MTRGNLKGWEKPIRAIRDEIEKELPSNNTEVDMVLNHVQDRLTSAVNMLGKLAVRDVLCKEKCSQCEGTGVIRFFFDQSTTKDAPRPKCFPEEKHKYEKLNRQFLKLI